MKWVLVRSPLSKLLYVLKRTTWEIFNAQAKQTGEAGSVLVAESDDRNELVRYQQLTKES